MLVFFYVLRGPPTLTLFPYTTLFRSDDLALRKLAEPDDRKADLLAIGKWRRVLRFGQKARLRQGGPGNGGGGADRKSTRLNSSHVRISYAVFCLKKKPNHDVLEL